jgi:sulfur relay protein TusB/DsrH
MSTLHIINRPSALPSCLEVAAESDTILLIEEAVHCALDKQPRPLIALRDDLESRELPTQLPDDTQLVDYPGFVDLVATHQPIVSWR